MKVILAHTQLEVGVLDHNNLSFHDDMYREVSHHYIDTMKLEISQLVKPTYLKAYFIHSDIICTFEKNYH